MKVEKGKTTLEIIHEIKETLCQFCQRSDKEVYSIVASGEYGLVEITCEDCYAKEVKKKLKKLIDEEL